MRFPCLLYVKHYTVDLCYKRVVVQIKKCNFQKHTVASRRRKTWKANGLNLKPRVRWGFSLCCHVGTGCHPACSGGGPASSQLLCAAADPAAFLLHYPDVGIVDAFSLSVPQSDSKTTLVYQKEKVFHLFLSQNIACIANIQI